MNNYYKNIRIN